MLTCRELIDFLNEYVDGTLDATRRAAFDAHLRACPDCVDYLSSYRATMELCKDAVADDAVPTDVPEDLIRAIVAARGR